jgi:peptide-methionine (S)-S-oxide reductase
MSFLPIGRSQILKLSLAVVLMVPIGHLVQRTFFSGSSGQQTNALIQVKPAIDLPSKTSPQTLVLAGGCFWGVEAVFEKLRGVTNVVSGYAGGSSNTAHYDLVGAGNTGHAEAVQITYDPQQISFGQLLQVFFAVAHDPTQVGGQGPDQGTQYRSAIFFASPAQQQVAQAYINQLNQAHAFSAKLVTTLEKLTQFYPAEDYHQNYIDRHPTAPYVVINDLPKINQLRQQFPTLLKK